MKPFDLEAAKRGERFEFYDLRVGEWRDASFVRTEQCFVVESGGNDAIYVLASQTERLRMNPKKVWYCRYYIDSVGQPQLASSEIPLMENWLSTGKWHGEPFTIEVYE